MVSTLNIPNLETIAMPAIGFGTWQIPESDAERAVTTAIKVGYRHIDCASVYGNEHAIGKCFETLKNRNELFVVSKLWSDCHEPSKVKLAFDTTLENLTLDYLDMYLIHTPCRIKNLMEPLWYSKEWILETWRELVKLKESGKVKNIGVSNFSSQKLKWLLEEDEKPSNNQVELHPYLPQNKLIKFCQDNGIIVTAYSPLGSPALPQFMPDVVEPGSPILLEDKTIQQIAQKHNKTPAQVLIKWGVNRGACVLVKSVQENRMKENIESINLNLSDGDMETIRKIYTHCRYLDFKLFCKEPHTVDDFWDGEYYN